MTEKTQREAILAHLIRCRPITPLEALDLYKCFRLGARIWELKQPQYGGHRIDRKMVTLPNGKCVAQYTYNFEREDHEEDRRDQRSQLLLQPGAA